MAWVFNKKITDYKNFHFLSSLTNFIDRKFQKT